MTGFVLIAAALVGVALFLVLRPLLARDDGDADQAKKLAALQAAHAAGVLSAEELAAKRAQLEATAGPIAPARPAMPLLAGAFAVAIPALAFALYWWNGEPRALDPANLVRAEAGTPQAPDMDAAIAGLAARMAQEPDNVEGWMLLGRAYKATQRFAEAQQALQRAFDLAPDNVDVMTEYAEALAMAAPGRRIEGRALELLQQALSRDPVNQRALWLTGAAAAQAERYPEAVAAWEKLLAQMPPESDVATTLREQIDKARERAGMAPAAGAPPAAMTATSPPDATAPSSAPATPAPPDDAPAAVAAAEPDEAAAAAAGPQITVSIDIAPALKAQLAPGDVLFVFARLPQGPRMPLAIQRVPASSLPLTLTLDDSMAMTPALKLSGAEQVVVGARVSKSGNATPQPGDFQVISTPLSVKTQTAPVALVISEVVQ